MSKHVRMFLMLLLVTVGIVFAELADIPSGAGVALGAAIAFGCVAQNMRYEARQR